MTQTPLIIALETSSRIGSVALSIGPRLLGQTVFSGPMKHSAELFGAVAGLLHEFDRKPSEVQQVFISVGPGSFTGLRIAVAFAKAANLANGARIVAVDTMDVIAANMAEYATASKTAPARTIATILDAKRGQFFVAAYAMRMATASNQDPIPSTDYCRIIPDSLMTRSQFAEQLAARHRPLWLLGDGLLYYGQNFQADGVSILDKQYWSPKASMVHRLGWELAKTGYFCDPVNLTPAYLRKPEIGTRKQSPGRKERP